MTQCNWAIAAVTNVANAACTLNQATAAGKDDVKMVKMQVDQSFAKIAVPDFSLHLLIPQAHEYYFVAYSYTRKKNIRLLTVRR